LAGLFVFWRVDILLFAVRVFIGWLTDVVVSASFLSTNFELVQQTVTADYCCCCCCCCCCEYCGAYKVCVSTASEQSYSVHVVSSDDFIMQRPLSRQRHVDAVRLIITALALSL